MAYELQVGVILFSFIGERTVFLIQRHPCVCQFYKGKHLSDFTLNLALGKTSTVNLNMLKHSFLLCAGYRLLWPCSSTCVKTAKKSRHQTSNTTAPQQRGKAPGQPWQSEWRQSQASPCHSARRGARWNTSSWARWQVSGTSVFLARVDERQFHIQTNSSSLCLDY